MGKWKQHFRLDPDKNNRDLHDIYRKHLYFLIHEISVTYHALYMNRNKLMHMWWILYALTFYLCESWGEAIQ